MEPLTVVCWIFKKFGPSTFKFCRLRSQRTFKVDFQVSLLFSVPRTLFFEEAKLHTQEKGYSRKKLSKKLSAYAFINLFT